MKKIIHPFRIISVFSNTSKRGLKRVGMTLEITNTIMKNIYVNRVMVPKRVALSHAGEYAMISYTIDINGDMKCGVFVDFVEHATKKKSFLI